MPFKKYIIIISFFLIPQLTFAWGFKGHYHISRNAELSFNEQMNKNFSSWMSFLIDHAIDPDLLSSVSPDEGKNHYINFDIYSGFNATGTIPQNFDTLINIYGYTFVKNGGLLPWATRKTYDSLVQCLKRLDIANAKQFAANLGHYIADGHNPLHLTENYNGQFTGNYGLHSRYETSVVNFALNDIVYDGMPIEEISDVNQYIFSYLYNSFDYVDSVLQSDNYAKSVNTNYSSTAFKTAFWSKAKDYTTYLFKEASHAFAQLLYSAWIEAGSPDISAYSVEEIENMEDIVSDVFPNPITNNEFNLKINITKPSDTFIKIIFVDGIYSKVLINKELPPAEHTLSFKNLNLSKGTYIVFIKVGDYITRKKVVYI